MYSGLRRCQIANGKKIVRPRNWDGAGPPKCGRARQGFSLPCPGPNQVVAGFVRLLAVAALALAALAAEAAAETAGGQQDLGDGAVVAGGDAGAQRRLALDADFAEGHFLAVQ